MTSWLLNVVCLAVGTLGGATMGFAIGAEITRERIGRVLRDERRDRLRFTTIRGRHE